MRKIGVVAAFLGITGIANAQSGWQHKDLSKDSIFGISTNRAYAELLKGKKGKPVIVAVIDSGVDTAHADLKSVLWRNKGEKQNNIDDDKNGYADDVHGWSFLGSKKGNVLYDNTELTRLIREGQKRFPNLKNLPVDTTGLAQYQTLRAAFNAKRKKALQQYNGISGMRKMFDTVLTKVGDQNPSRAALIAFDPNNMAESQARTMLVQALDQWPDITTYLRAEIDPALAHYHAQTAYLLNLEYDSREVVGDDYANTKETLYGSADAMGPNAKHGTHVAGIIAADRNNLIGTEGVADLVKIMVVRAIPEGDERDKDVANAIRYAVDNGASIINMSFGKFFSPNKSIVDEAVQYAMKKDVLLVHAAGNESENIDEVEHFPTNIYANGGEAAAWIEVGASTQKWGDSLVAVFSNYGEHTVDVFAPGVAIYATVPGSVYENMDGTSMATPVVAGVAALIRSYYPTLSAVQVKQAIVESVVKYPGEVYYKQNGIWSKKPFAQFSKSGGVVNAYTALQAAAKMVKK
ncbi:subtilase family protein [Chitinophaga skermanii]|uniref:Subtilase family protein n=1 Tax=Chitinophaga skermanii TaxID=331697 RepID=A0A327QW36_9BACT|nr:S8 family peptidase [Chitinophaga skermanii]RAJ08876.1 subtilase family protein [Chitinophaga skermanii]